MAAILSLRVPASTFVSAQLRQCAQHRDRVHSECCAQCTSSSASRPRNDGLIQQKSPRRGFFNSRLATRSVRVGPDLLLGEVHQARKQDQEHEHLHADPLARFHVRLRGPHQERRDVLGVLRNRRRRAVVEGHLAVAQRLRHLDGVAGEILVVVGAVRECLTPAGGLSTKPCRIAIDVVRTLLLELGEEVEDELREAALVGPRLGDQRQVRRQRAAIGGARGLLVGERRGEVIGRPARPVEHLALRRSGRP